MAYNRITIGEYFGELSYPSTSFNVLLDDVWKACQRRGAISGLRRYETGGDSATAIGPTYNVIFPPTWNAKTNYGSPATLDVLPSAFDGRENASNTRQGLIHLDANPNPSSPVTYQALHVIAANQPHTLRISFAKTPDKTDAGAAVVSLFRRTWGGIGAGAWRLEIRNGNAVVQRFKSTYTTPLDTELDALLLTDERTIAQETRVGELKALLFEVEESVPLVSKESAGFTQPTTLTFICEPRGVVHIECLETGEKTVIEIPSLLKKRMTTSSNTGSVPNVVWASSSPKIVSHAGVFAWQEGRPDFAKSGKIRTGEWAPGFGLGTVDVKGQWDTSLPGTGVTFINEGLGDDDQPPLYVVVGATPQKNEFVATLTSSGVYPAFLYAAETSTAAGPRTGENVVVWDSDDHLTQGASPIKNIIANYDGENRRLGWTVELRCVKQQNASNELGEDFPEEIHDRLIDVWIGGVRLVRKGYITSVIYNNWKSVDASPFLENAGFNASIVLEVSDLWSVLDDDLMTDDPIGDGRTLGAYIRTILINAGFTSLEIAGVGAGTGRVLPSAALGEAFAVRPAVETSRGDYLRELLEKYGMGLRLYWDNALGSWQLAEASNAVKAAFSSSATEAITGYRIEGGVTETHDYSSTFNIFQAQGAPDAETGNRITKGWNLWEGLRSPNNYAYQGRRRRMQTVRDDALRTPDDVAYVVRSLANKHGQNGRWVQFNTWFKPNLYPGDLITADGVLARIERIDSADISKRVTFNNDSTVRAIGNMTIIARKLQYGARS